MLPLVRIWSVKVGEPEVVTVPPVGDCCTIGPRLTVRVKLWVALGETPLLAVMVKGKFRVSVGAGVPESTPVELFSVTPVGSEPAVTEKVGAG